MDINSILCPVCGFYCSGRGGLGCISKPDLLEENSLKSEFEVLKSKTQELREEHLIKTFTFEDALSLTDLLEEPYKWQSHRLTVLRDGYLDCGTRIHVVEEQNYHTPQMISNAIIISEDLELRGK